MIDDRRRVFRKTDWIGIAVGVATLGGVIWAAVKKPEQWDSGVQRVNEITPIVYQTKNRVDVMEAHYEDILRRLDSIDRKLNK